MFSVLAPICCAELEQKQLPYLLTSVWKTDACIPEYAEVGVNIITESQGILIPTGSLGHIRD